METVELKNFSHGTSKDTENEEESNLCPQDAKDTSTATNQDDEQRPWHALVTYVDELTVGARRNSKGQYVDGVGSFPGFGKKKMPKIPPNCFPPRCYERSGIYQTIKLTNYDDVCYQLRISL